jgi:predicted  nucleic acid-binding Zn ribbon protein
VATQVILLGPEAESLQPCECSRTSLILYTRYDTLESSLRCGDCFGPVALYEIPEQPAGVYRGELHDEIRSWTSDYASCDRLQMNCATGERFGLHQMGDPGSSLSRRGRAIASRIEEAMGRPTFYYLHRYRGRSLKSERARLCPLCHGEWRLNEREHKLFDFRCEKCRLLSNMAMSIGR